MNGKCLCGSIEFIIKKDDIKLYQCHCSLCRKQSGTYSNAATIVPNKYFQFLKGTSFISSWEKNSGFRSDFCMNCGSPVPNPLRETEYHWIPAGLLENEERLVVVSHIYTDSKASWDKPNPNAENHAGFPQGGLEAHIRALK
ncbi:GFA family protein [Teredinibacter haidensis]|uniref:GFA family protein n=1 Tax=Teredinibacter haidensis TaxID=2731755 RepID=UPI000948F29D|nr:GFA family protein [Teredinibacter haidensis]